MSLKIEFVERFKRGEKIAPLCKEFRVSRTTGHKWVKRFEANGYDGLEDKSRRPKSTPLATGEDAVLAVLETREKHPRWGARTLALYLRKKLGEGAPSERTIARILRRAGKVRERRQRRRLSIVDHAPRVQATCPNDVWTVDFKGWWRARNGERCEPLTIRDAFSRCVLAIELCPAQAGEVRRVMEKLFRRHGVPRAIQCDNGEPFVAVQARGGLTTLSAWWVSLGVEIVRSRVGCPQDNGAHERMHSDIAAEVEANPADSRALQQRPLDRWRQEFNHVRPHQALGGKTPSEVYKPTERRRPVVQEYRYPPRVRVRSVNRHGSIYFAGGHYFVSQSLRGQDVGVELVDALHARVWFRGLDLGTLEIEPEITADLVARWVDDHDHRGSRDKNRTSPSPRKPQVAGLPPAPPLDSPAARRSPTLAT